MSKQVACDYCNEIIKSPRKSRVVSVEMEKSKVPVLVNVYPAPQTDDDDDDIDLCSSCGDIAIQHAAKIILSG